MSASDFKPVNVTQSEIANITSQLPFAVSKGASQYTPQIFQSTSGVGSVPTNLIFNIQVPSNETLLSKRVLLRTSHRVSLSLVNTGASINAPSGGWGSYVYGYGVQQNGFECALAPFPCHMLFNNMQSTINNSTVNMQIRDLLPELLCFYDKRELARYNGMCPTKRDSLYVYANGFSGILDDLSSYVNVNDRDLVPRGAWVLKNISSSLGNNAWNNGATNTWTFDVETTEPLMISPWQWNAPDTMNGAIYGITNLNFVFNYGDASRFFRVSNSPTISMSSISVTNVNSAELIFEMYTPHVTQMLPSRNVSTYMEFPRYFSSVPAINAAGTAGSTVKCTSQNLQLNVIPDKLIVVVRKKMSLQTNTDADAFLKIKNVSIQWNNQAGLLSTATTQNLYQLSVRAGSNQNWFEFDGQANVAGSGQPNKTPLSGSCLILDFATAIAIPEDYYAPNCIGQFNLYLTADVENQSSVNYGANDLEMLIVTVNSGIFVTEKGNSQPFVGLLSKADVLAVSEQPANVQPSIRMVGGGFFDTLSNAVGSIASVVRPIASIAKPVLGMIADPRAQLASRALGAVGFGGKKGKAMSAGALSAGAMSAGRDDPRLY